MFSASMGVKGIQRPKSVSGAAEARRIQTESTFMQIDLDRLFMITEALWTFLRDKHGYSDSDLEEMIQEIDLRDGKLDGKVAGAPPQKCESCTRPLLRSKPFCIYCGKPASGQTFAR